MSKHFNDFCCYCTGKDYTAIKKCDDTNCPFYPFKYGGLEKEVEKDICKKILREGGIIDE
jgi:hypothetical protein